jgi:hypothetical protein
MKTLSKLIRGNITSMTILFLLTSVCFGQNKGFTTEQMASQSTSILYGKCTKVQSAWTEEKDMILTTVTIVPEYYLKGDLGTEVTITVPGGQVDDIIYEISEMPTFRKGEEVFTFLWVHPSGQTLVTGGFQGKMEIVEDKTTGIRTVSGRQLSFSTPRDADEAPTDLSTKEKRIPLEEFTSEIKGYLK